MNPDQPYLSFFYVKVPEEFMDKIFSTIRNEFLGNLVPAGVPYRGKDYIVIEAGSVHDEQYMLNVHIKPYIEANTLLTPDQYTALVWDGQRMLPENYCKKLVDKKEMVLCYLQVPADQIRNIQVWLRPVLEDYKVNPGGLAIGDNYTLFYAIYKAGPPSFYDFMLHVMEKNFAIPPHEVLIETYAGDPAIPPGYCESSSCLGGSGPKK